MLTRDPALATHFRAMAASPYDLLAQLADEAAKRKRLSELVYTEKEHGTNPYRRVGTKDADHETMARFRATYGDEQVEVWSWEGRHSVSLPWTTGPGTQRTQLSEIITDLRAKPIEKIPDTVVMEAAAIDAALVKALRADANAKAAEAAERANELAAAARR